MLYFLKWLDGNQFTSFRTRVKFPVKAPETILSEKPKFLAAQIRQSCELSSILWVFSTRFHFFDNLGTENRY